MAQVGRCVVFRSMKLVLSTTFIRSVRVWTYKQRDMIMFLRVLDLESNLQCFIRSSPQTVVKTYLHPRIEGLLPCTFEVLLCHKNHLVQSSSFQSSRVLLRFCRVGRNEEIQTSTVRVCLAKELKINAVDQMRRVRRTLWQ